MVKGNSFETAVVLSWLSPVSHLLLLGTATFVLLKLYFQWSDARKKSRSLVATGDGSQTFGGLRPKSQISARVPKTSEKRSLLGRLLRFIGFHLTLGVLIFLAAVVWAVGCESKMSEFRLVNGNVLLEYEGRQWEVAQADVPRAEENLRARGVPYAPWSEEETRNWFGCADAGGLWRQDDKQCVWSLSHYHNKPRTVKP